MADLIVIVAIDTGSGISEENLARMMELFITPKEVGKDTGLCLSICYGIMKKHAGTIEGGPRSSTKGAQVTLKFPLGGESSQKRETNR